MKYVPADTLIRFSSKRRQYTEEYCLCPLGIRKPRLREIKPTVVVKLSSGRTRTHAQVFGLWTWALCRTMRPAGDTREGRKLLSVCPNHMGTTFSRTDFPSGAHPAVCAASTTVMTSASPASSEMGRSPGAPPCCPRVWPGALVMV